MTAGDDAECGDAVGARPQREVPPPACGGERRVIHVIVNEKQVQIDKSTTVAALLASMGYPDRGIAVAMDQAVLPRSGWSRTLSDGARLEVVTAVQGG